MGKVKSKRGRSAQNYFRSKPKNKTHYMLQPYLAKQFNAPPFDTALVDGQSFSVDGQINEHVLVSVPETISTVSARDLFENLQEAFQKPIIMVTHNVQFLSARKMTALEVSRMENLRENRGNGYAQAETDSDTDTGTEAITRDEDKSVQTSGDWGGSGIGENGDNVPRADREGETEGVSCAGDGNETGEEKG